MRKSFDPKSRLSWQSRRPLHEEPLSWEEPLTLAWPDLPEEIAPTEETELRVARELEHRIRLDREQSGMSWNERLF
jgi:hypothetical protein